MEKKSKFLSVKQVAEYLEVSKQAVDKWINAGELKVYRLPSGRIKILRSDFLNYVKTNNLYLDKDFFNIPSKKIVVIDDDTSVHEVFKVFFNELDPKPDVEYAKDGISGLLRIGASKADMVVLDIEMPGMNGIELCEKILADDSLAGIGIVVISGYLSKYEEDLQKLGIETTIEKPFDYRDLHEKLLPVLNELSF
jgi:excisionase family DNA binding protein